MRLKFCEHEKYKMKMNMHKTHDSTSKAQDIETPPQRFLPAHAVSCTQTSLGSQNSGYSDEINIKLSEMLKNLNFAQ